jgi:hypothetical protein
LKDSIQQVPASSKENDRTEVKNSQKEQQTQNGEFDPGSG